MGIINSGSLIQGTVVNLFLFSDQNGEPSVQVQVNTWTSLDGEPAIMANMFIVNAEEGRRLAVGDEVVVESHLNVTLLNQEPASEVEG